MPEVILLLGSNTDDSRERLAAARRAIGGRIGCIIRASAEHTTAPEGAFEPGQGQHVFLNQALAVDTGLEPLELLTATRRIETEAGRLPRPAGSLYRDRPLDIDILFYGDLVMDTPGLTIPHPRIAERRFVLEPLSEVAPGFKHPVSGFTIEELLAKMQ